MSVSIYHNPACGTSRNTLALKLYRPAEGVLDAKFANKDGEVVPNND